MLITTVTISNPVNNNSNKNDMPDYSLLMLLPFAIVAARHFTKKQMRKAKRTMFWQIVKEQVKSKFSFKSGKKKAPLLKALLILIGITAVFGLIFGFTAAVAAFVITLLFLAIYGSEL